MVLVVLLLNVLNKNLKRIINEKQGVGSTPSFYQSKIKPVISKWNPIIATLSIGTIVILLVGAWFFNFAKNEVGVQKGYAPEQPIAYSHAFHAGKSQIECQYCHSTASYAKSASIPSANTCMNCHKGVQAREKYDGEVSPEIQKIYNAVGYDPDQAKYIDNYDQKPIKWVRIHNLPDLAYFNHSQHVKVGNLECQLCHGPIQEMEKVYQYSNLQMGWCINCHRQRGIDAENNDYYEEIHKKMKIEGKTYYTVAQNGGLECSKCHY